MQNSPRLTCKPHSVQWDSAHLGGHLSGTQVTLCLMQPTRDCEACASGDEQPPALRHCPCLALLLAAVTWQPALQQAPVVSYTAVSPLPIARRIVSVALCGRLPHPGCYPVPCSLECGLSSTLQTQCRDHPASLGISYYYR